MATIETTVNDAIANILCEMRRAWASNVVSSEKTRKLLTSPMKRPDILVTEPGTSPVVIEAEFAPARTVESDAKSRLGQQLLSGRPILSSIAVQIPARYKELEGKALTAALMIETGFGICCFTGRTNSHYERWPEEGWIRGNLADLSLVCQSMALPSPLIKDTATRLSDGIAQAEVELSQITKSHPTAVETIARLLKQQDGKQTRRMAMTIVANAMMLHGNLAGRGGGLSKVRSMPQLLTTGDISQIALLEDWRKILLVNYWPIIDIARRIVESIPVTSASSVLTILANTAQSMLKEGLTQSHDLVGAIFQTLISDRKFLAAFYTRPASAALLAGMAISPEKAPNGEPWSSETIKQLRIGDFACGTGTLLSMAYKAVRAYHEINGGDETVLHPTMMSGGLVGCDIMPAAVHITASMLSSAVPSVTYEDTSLMTMPYGKWGDDETISLGSLDLLRSQRVVPALATHEDVITIGATGAKHSDMWKHVDHNSFDLVMMNPPYTSPTNHEGKHKDIPNPMFAAFQTPAGEQKAMANLMPALTAGTCYHGNAGQGSAFLALAHHKLKPGGTLAIVLQLSILAGTDGEKCRALLRQEYRDICVITIAAGRPRDLSFSADTDMAECLVIATKGSTSAKRGTFVTLKRCPTSELEGAAIARAIRKLRTNCQKLESGPVGGTRLLIGEDSVGALLDAPIPANGPWPITRMKDMELAQTAFQLTINSRLWLSGMVKEDIVRLPMTPLNSLAAIGPISRDINSGYEAGVLRGPFDIVPIEESQAVTKPTLWRHHLERSMILAPDSQAMQRKGKDAREDKLIQAKADKVWRTASRCHFNVDFQYNSQSVVAAFTEQPTIGGRAWPSLIFENVLHEKAFSLWSNSTLGVLCHWWSANKTQSGRGSIKPKSILATRTLDLTRLTDHQLKKAGVAFDKYKACLMPPINEIDHDATRNLIDHAILVDVLGFPEVILSNLDLLREKLAAEPSIAGGKQIKVGAIKSATTRPNPLVRGNTDPHIRISVLYAKNAGLLLTLTGLCERNGLLKPFQKRQGVVRLSPNFTRDQRDRVVGIISDKLGPYDAARFFSVED